MEMALPDAIPPSTRFLSYPSYIPPARCLFGFPPVTTDDDDLNLRRNSRIGSHIAAVFQFYLSTWQ